MSEKGYFRTWTVSSSDASVRAARHNGCDSRSSVQVHWTKTDSVVVTFEAQLHIDLVALLISTLPCCVVEILRRSRCETNWVRPSAEAGVARP